MVRLGVLGKTRRVERESERVCVCIWEEGRRNDFPALILPPKQRLNSIDTKGATQPVPFVAAADPEADVGVTPLVAAAGVHEPAERDADGGAEG